MFTFNLRLINMLGIITTLIILSLVLDYCRIIKRPVRIGLAAALVGIVIALVMIMPAVLPDNQFYGTVYSHGETSKKIVALTFDDGPYSPYTEQILDVLKQNDIKATFFVVGANVEKNPSLLQKIIQDGHQIGNHTYHHIDLLKLNQKRMTEEISATNKLIKAVCGVTPHVLRPPHGFRDPVVLRVAKDFNMRVVEWSVMSRDWTNPGVEAIVSRTLNSVKSGSIILLHDGDGADLKAPRAQTVEAARRIIFELKKRGYKFVTVDEILTEVEENNECGLLSA